MEFEDIISLMVEKGYLSDETKETVLSDGDFQKKKKGRVKKTTEERRGKYDVNKCQARIWHEGYDNIQCHDIKLTGGSLCENHQTCSDKDGGWWLGMIQDPIPEKPTWRGVEHFWRTDNEVGDLVEKEPIGVVPPPEPKKKRGRPKGSKNKKKKTSEKNDLTIEEMTIILEQKLKEEKEKKEKKEKKEQNEEMVEDNVDGDCMKYIVDGVPYEITGNDIMDPEDFSVIGVTDGKGGINFVGEEEEEKHIENVEKYNV
jgi:hypothetical protein